MIHALLVPRVTRAERASYAHHLVWTGCWGVSRGRVACDAITRLRVFVGKTEEGRIEVHWHDEWVAHRHRLLDVNREGDLL